MCCSWNCLILEYGERKYKSFAPLPRLCIVFAACLRGRITLLNHHLCCSTQPSPRWITVCVIRPDPSLLLNHRLCYSTQPSPPRSSTWFISSPSIAFIVFLPVTPSPGIALFYHSISIASLFMLFYSIISPLNHCLCYSTKPLHCLCYSTRLFLHWITVYVILHDHLSIIQRDHFYSIIVCSVLPNHISMYIIESLFLLFYSTTTPLSHYLFWIIVFAILRAPQFLNWSTVCVTPSALTL